MNEHLLKRFDEELTKLKYRLVKMGTLVQQQLEMAFRSLIENNREHAVYAIEIEDKVNKLDIKIDKQCLRIFALHQPVAMDLRMVLSAVRINDHFELLGDLATDIAKMVNENPIDESILRKTKFSKMCESILLMLTKLMDSLVYMNNQLSIETVKLNFEVEELYNQNFTELKNLCTNEPNINESCIYLTDINRSLVTISREIAGIAQELVFMFEARLIKHKKFEDIYGPDEEEEE